MANTKQLPIRLTEAQRAALRRIMDHNGFVDFATTIRWLIQQEDRRNTVPTVPTTPAAIYSEAEDLD